MSKERVAIIGAGVAGITAAYLLDQKFDVTLFEKNDYVGGHTNTIDITSGLDSGTAVDTGFIVLNDRTYPLLHKLLKRLGVSVRSADMSFSFYSEKDRNGYASRGLNTLFAYRANLFNASYWRFLSEVLRFWRQSVADLEVGKLVNITVSEYLRINKYSTYFFENYLAPFAGAIWSAPQQGVLDFPIELLVRFFKNHGMLSYSDQPQWQTVVGGSREYVRAFERVFGGKIVRNAGILGVRRSEDAVQVRLADSSLSGYDRVIIATHADQALNLLEDPNPLEQELLGVWKYQSNDVFLHTDVSQLPPNRRLWAAWNYTRFSADDVSKPVSVTYSMNILQGLQTLNHYCVSLNPRRPIEQKHLLRHLVYEHPIFDFAALRSQDRLQDLNLSKRLKFCGSYFRYGFHEDAVGAAVNAVQELGVTL